MSKRVNFQNGLIIDGKTIINDKDFDGKMHSIGLMLDPDYNKQLFVSSDTLSCYLLKCCDKWDSYYWNCCAGNYFSDEGVL